MAFRSNVGAMSKNNAAAISLPHGKKVTDGVHVQVCFMSVLVLNQCD